MAKKSEINIKVELDDQNIPHSIYWSAEGLDLYQKKAKAFFLSMFDDESNDTLKLDIWTKEFQTSEMDRFMYASLTALSETYLKATNNVDLANDFKNFAIYFGEKTEIIQKNNPIS